VSSIQFITGVITNQTVHLNESEYCINDDDLSGKMEYAEPASSNKSASGFDQKELIRPRKGLSDQLHYVFNNHISRNWTQDWKAGGQTLLTHSADVTAVSSPTEPNSPADSWSKYDLGKKNESIDSSEVFQTNFFNSILTFFGMF